MKEAVLFLKKQFQEAGSNYFVQPEKKSCYHLEQYIEEEERWLPLASDVNSILKQGNY